MQLYISIQLLDIWRVGKVDESLWYAWLLQHLNVRLREVHWFPVLYLWQWKETATTLGPSNGEFAGEGTVQKEVFQEGEEIRRGGGRSAWPGRSVSTTKDHLNHSIISIISPACCEIDGVEHGFDGASGKISRARLGLVFCGRLWWFADVCKDVLQLSSLMFDLPKPPSRLARWRSARRNCRGSCYM